MALTDEQLRDTDEFRNIYAYITETNWTGYDDVCRRALQQARDNLLLRDTNEFRNVYAHITETNWTGYNDVSRRALQQVRAGLSELDMIILEQKANK